MNECYQCETPIDAPTDAVHPLCDECEKRFDSWFSQQLIQLGGK